ncbi:MAG: hypothetical protein BWK75_02835 [Candidatus Altiarchaeales archaeon A3]|nr:MAG: hypothetical protein BWK75_02835 [Candidatus Altiarchaeales archaeon A3]
MLNKNKPFVDVQKIVNEITDAANEKNIKYFEDEFSKYINASRSIATNQGRSALLLALKILGVKKSDEVIVQSLICSVVIDAILELGATPVLVDNSIKDYNVSPSKIEKKITPKTKVIIAAHLYGVPCDIKEILSIARENNCYLIEDCAHTIGAKYNGKNVGTYGDISFFSFNFGKPMSTGDGGMLVINNNKLIEKANDVLKDYERTPIASEKEMIYALLVQHFLTQREFYNIELPNAFCKKLLRRDKNLFSLIDNIITNKSSEKEIENRIVKYLKNHNILPEKESLLVSNPFIRDYALKFEKLLKYLPLPMPSKANKIESKFLLMNSLRSTVGLIALESIDQVNKIRNENAKYFADTLNDSWTLPTIDKEKEPAFLYYTVLNNTKYSVSQINVKGKKQGFELGNYNWLRPVHLKYPYSKLLSYNQKELKNSEYLSSHLINLPVHYYVSGEDLENINGFMNNRVVAN